MILAGSSSASCVRVNPICVRRLRIFVCGRRPDIEKGKHLQDCQVHHNLLCTSLGRYGSFTQVPPGVLQPMPISACRFDKLSLDSVSLPIYKGFIVMTGRLTDYMLYTTRLE